MDDILRYNEIELVHGLSEVSADLRVAFAAACAQRVFPAYVTFSKNAGKPLELEMILEQVWNDLLSNGSDRLESEQIQRKIDRCMALIPGEDQPWSVEQEYAEDAVAALAYALRTLKSGEPQEAAWAARRAYEALDHYIGLQLGIEDSGQILTHPVVQTEIRRQYRDLHELQDSPQDVAKGVALLRERARVESDVFFTV